MKEVCVPPTRLVHALEPVDEGPLDELQDLLVPVPEDELPQGVLDLVVALVRQQRPPMETARVLAWHAMSVGRKRRRSIVMRRSRLPGKRGRLKPMAGDWRPGKRWLFLRQDRCSASPHSVRYCNVRHRNAWSLLLLSSIKPQRRGMGCRSSRCHWTLSLFPMHGRPPYRRTVVPSAVELSGHAPWGTDCTGGPACTSAAAST